MAWFGRRAEKGPSLTHEDAPGLNRHERRMIGSLVSNTVQAFGDKLRTLSPFGGKDDPNVQKVRNFSEEELVRAADYQMWLARNLMRRDGAPAQQGVKTLVTSIIGTGPTPDSPYFELNEGWWDFDASGDITGKMTISQMLAHAKHHQIVDGNALIIRVPDDSALGFKVQFIAADRLPAGDCRQLENGNRVIGGVEVDGNGKPVAYHICKKVPKPGSYGGYNDQVRVPAEDVIHLYRPAAAESVRGVTWLAAVVTMCAKLGIYFDAELQRKIVSALHVGVIKKPTSEAALPGQDDLTGKLVEMSMEPGAFTVAPPGWDVEFSSPTDTSGNATAFLDRLCLLIACALGVPYELVFGDWSKSGDRTGVLTATYFDQVIEVERDLAKTQCLDKMWRWYVTARILNGSWTPPEGISEERIYDSKWVWPRREFMRPLQELQANKAAVDNGFDSRDAVVMRAGLDVTQNDIAILSGAIRWAVAGLSSAEQKITVTEKELNAPLFELIREQVATEIDRMVASEKIRAPSQKTP